MQAGTPGTGQSFPGKPVQRPPAINRNASLNDVSPQPNSASSLMAGLFGGIANIIQQPNPEPQQVVQEEEEFLERYHPSLKYLEKFKDKCVLVTGATGAVGSSVAKKLLKSQCKMIVLFVRDKDNVDDKIMAAVEEEDSRVKLVQIDMREPQRIEQKFSTAIKTYFEGELDHIIMCHGIVVEKGVITCTIPKYDQTMLVNVRSMMHMVSLAQPFLKKAAAEKGGASITILTSAQGNKPDPKSPVMSAAAAMVQMLIKVTSLEVAFFGVRVNGVATGVINSQYEPDSKTVPARMKQDLMAMEFTPD